MLQLSRILLDTPSCLPVSQFQTWKSGSTTHLHGLVEVAADAAADAVAELGPGAAAAAGLGVLRVPAALPVHVELAGLE